MSFEIGQTVVYPHHGAATIEEVMTRTIRGEERTYLKLRVNQGDLEIQVPAENVDMVGVRDIVDEDGLEEVLSVLRAPYLEEPTNWSRRFKANQEKIATGDIVKVAEVVRVIRESGLPNRTTSMFTEIEGDWDEVMQVVRDATFVLANKGIRTEVVLKADIRPGFTDTMTGKLERMEAQIKKQEEAR